jgi:hypothetical protein
VATNALVADATVAALGLMCLLSWLRSLPLLVRLCYGGLTMAALFDVAVIVAAAARNEAGRGATAAHQLLLAAAAVTVVAHLTATRSRWAARHPHSNVEGGRSARPRH